MRTFAFPVLLLALAACTSGSSGSGNNTPPPPLPPYGTGCRCVGFELHLALVHVEDTPVAFRDDLHQLPGISGMEFNVVIEQLLPVTRDLYHIAPPPAVASRIHARQGLLGPEGVPLRDTVLSDSPTVHVERGQRLLVAFSGVGSPVPSWWGVLVLAADPTTGALTRPWYGFPTGTPARQVLDAAEWNDPCRGCSTCTVPSTLVPVCPGSDAAIDTPATE